MPKIRIREKDRTPNDPRYVNETVVFLTDEKAKEGTLTVLEPDDGLTDADLSGYANKDKIGAILALGGKVVVGKTYSSAKDYLKDRNQFNIKFLMVDEYQGEGEDLDAPDLIDALEIAVARRDCAVVYSKRNPVYSQPELEVLNTPVGESPFGGDEFLNEETGLLGKYCLPFFCAPVRGNQEYNPGLGYILAFLRSVNNGNAEWLAVAGAKRGVIPADVNVGFLTEDEIDAMQPTVGEAQIGEEEAINGSFSINPILLMNPWGVRIWGNRTALKLPEGEGLTASHFANIRVLICDLKKRLYQAARAYQFEQNNDVLWVNFQSSVNVLLEEMVQSSGIYGYKWIREETDEKAKLKATLRIIPIEPVEDFDLTLELADSLEVTE